MARVLTLLFAVGVSCCSYIAVGAWSSFRTRRMKQNARSSDTVVSETDHTNMEAASSSLANNSVAKHHVFISFRGEDTRTGFTSHLKEALHRAKIQTYIDDGLKKGDEIAPSLLEAISGSKLSVIVFSKNYASSSWCLDELVHIYKCRDLQFIIPIFYNVAPSVVRKQSGSYSDAFVEHEKRTFRRLQGKGM